MISCFFWNPWTEMMVVIIIIIIIIIMLIIIIIIIITLNGGGEEHIPSPSANYQTLTQYIGLQSQMISGFFSNPQTEMMVDSKCSRFVIALHLVRIDIKDSVTCLADTVSVGRGQKHCYRAVLIKFCLKEKLPQAFMQIKWMENDFRNLTAKVGQIWTIQSRAMIFQSSG